MDRTLRLVFMLLRAPEIDHQQTPSRFEHAGHFSESLTLEIIRHDVHHKGAQNDIKRLVGESKLFDYANLEVDRQVCSPRFGTGTSDLLQPRVDARHLAHRAHALLRGD